jgi:4'-phosphopantetheinyl transferase
MLHRPIHTLGTNEVHVWHLLADRLTEAAPALAMLSPEERQRMNCYAHTRDRHLFAWSRCLMRSVLASYRDCRCDDLCFTVNAYGKPVLQTNGEKLPLHFNLSHSRGAIALVVSGDRLVGVDVEERVRKVDFLGLAQRYFSAEEARHLEMLDESQRADAFFAIWTLKEAYVKGIGRGLTFPLDAFCFDLDGDRLLRFRPLADFVAADWHFHQFALGERHCGAVAVQGVGVNFQMRDWAAVFLV